MIDFFRLTDIESTIVKTLQKREYVTLEGLICVVYSLDNEPENSYGCMRVFVCRLKKKLAAQGYKLESTGGGRGNKAKYRLVNEME